MEPGPMAEPCPACTGPVAPLLTAVDGNRGRSDRVFPYGRCGRCGLVMLLDVPDDLAEHYGDDYYRQPTRAELKRVAGREHYQIEMVLEHVQGGVLVEIGPAWGVFALQARTAGFEVLALEQDATCCAYLRDIVGVEARETDRPEKLLREVTGASAVALWQVIEHLPDPLGLVDAAADALAPGGVLVIATPNPTSWGFRRMRRRWPHLDAPRHLWLLPPDVLVERARAAGLELVELTFDDAGSRSWNRFAWQRLLMNQVRGRTAQRIGFVVGAALSIAASPLERRGHRPSSYTVILRKA